MRNAFLAILLFSTSAAIASPELDAAIENVRRNCGGISDSQADMKRMAGINTAVTGVGTVAGGVALGTGIAKTAVDKEIENLEKEIERMKSERGSIPVENLTIQNMTEYSQNVQSCINSYMPLSQQKEQELAEDREKSKNLGNIRTGTLAANTVTNIAGAAIAGSNHINNDLQSQIDSCIASVNDLNRALGQARISGNTSHAKIMRAQTISAECGMWGTVNLANVNKRATGAATSSGIGAGVGAAGTIVSILANSQSVRNGDTQKEKNLNTAANVMAGGATVASATATIFNATQISAIKHAATVADKCEGALN